VTDRPGADVQRVRALLDGAGMRTALLTPEQHDEATSYLQVLPHAVLLAFADVLAAAPLNLDQLVDLAPPPARALLALACRVLTSTPEVYWDIQHANPEAAARRSDLSAALAALGERVEGGHAETFRAALAATATRLGPHLDAGADACRRMLHDLDWP
jgi:4-amino-4-deoxyprephenate dehydrogenase